ncbi:uncharacterized protein LOC119685056 [Teleopsis dalmanni]|uniref:uncharacterized protein LOC119685056 n=1 Tax=Teleopsis dalmanni TaxID=139649 RepID=UPI0018CEE871|nr:uncharacterized protein LOC119685056 [Teleopsis dalmanni]
MAFQRSYSKVWWGSDNQLPGMSSTAGSSFTSGGYYSYFSQQHQQQQQQQQQHHQQFSSGNSGYHSLDFNNFKSYPGNLSCIQEVDDEQNISKLSWEKRDSPGSLRSQDSGFSDNDESHSTRSLSGRSTQLGSPSAKSDVSAQSIGSPTSTHTIATPPTVIRRVGNSAFFSPLVSVSRRISFSGSPVSNASSNKVVRDVADKEGADLLAQLDEMQLVNSTPKKLDFEDDNLRCLTPTGSGDKREYDTETGSSGSTKHKRRKRVSRKPTKPLTATRRRTLLQDNNETDEASDASSFEEIDKDELKDATLPAYNNETVYLGAVPPKPYNNETVILGGNLMENTNDNTFTIEAAALSPIKGAVSEQYTANTSTPKAVKQHKKSRVPQYDFIMPVHEYENPLLNGHPPALQSWLGDLRMSYEHEVMSTLQTKSIVQEAFKNLTITTNSVAKLIRQLQQRAMYLQADFERIERILSGTQTVSLYDALNNAEHLIENVAEFTKVLERRLVFFNESRMDRKKYEENIEQIKIITRDTRYSLERQHYINMESLLEDLQVLRRILLLALRAVFEKMVRVIVQSIEQGRCDLMLRANINMIATLMNIEYEGFGSLTDAFVQNETVRTLLIVCLENKLTNVRALALRALATICCAPAAIAQLGACGGIEILRDILHVQYESEHEVSIDVRHGDIERREAVSLLTQITAPWHGTEHCVDGLKDCVETIVEGLTQLIANTSCIQTLLLCAAALNNLSRIEITSHYSIMSNEAIFKLIETVQKLDDGVSIFLYEQIVAMLHNMSLNKKCHSHLANGSIINFITSIYQVEFYKSYDSRAECDAQRRTIKMILHTLTRLVHDSSLGIELLEQQSIPAFLKLAVAATVSTSTNGNNSTNNSTNVDYHIPLDFSHNSHSRDISLLARQLQLANKQAEQLQQDLSSNDGSTSGGSTSGGSDAVVASEATAKTISATGKSTVVSTGLKLNLSRQESFV